MDAKLMERTRRLVEDVDSALSLVNARTVQDMLFYIAELEEKVSTLMEKVKNQRDRIRVLEGPTNHACGLKQESAQAITNNRQSKSKC